MPALPRLTSELGESSFLFLKRPSVGCLVTAAGQTSTPTLLSEGKAEFQWGAEKRRMYCFPPRLTGAPGSPLTGMPRAVRHGQGHSAARGGPLPRSAHAHASGKDDCHHPRGWGDGVAQTPRVGAWGAGGAAVTAEPRGRGGGPTPTTRRWASAVSARGAGRGPSDPRSVVAPSGPRVRPTPLPEGLASMT